MWFDPDAPASDSTNQITYKGTVLGKALEGVRVLDMTHVQSGPSCTQILAWLGADVVKLEAPAGDVTRKQLRDIPNVDSLYFTMLNCNKRSITLNMKSAEGKRIFADLLPRFDILAENFGPGAIERMGFGWDEVQRINPRLIFASIKGFGDGPYTHYKAYEVIAQAMGGSMSTTGFEEGPPLATGAQIGDSGTGIHTVAGILAALYQREHTGRGQRVTVAMQHAVLNLCRVKLRDHQRLQHGPLGEYPNEEFGDSVPRSGNASGGGQPGWAVKCAPGGPNDYIYVVVQPVGWEPIANLIGRPELVTDPEWSTPQARLNKLDKMFQLIEEWTMGLGKWQALAILTEHNIPCGPILSTKRDHRRRLTGGQRHGRSGGASRARRVHHRRLPDQAVRLPRRRPPLPFAGRAQRTHLRRRARAWRPALRAQGERGHLTIPPPKKQTVGSIQSQEGDSTRMNAPAQSKYREVIDDNGRVYRIGETDRDILGRSRAWMVWMPWIAMMAISSSEYAFTSAEDTLVDAHHWGHGHIFWLLGVWVFFQAAVAFPAGKLRESGKLSARAAMMLGAVGSLIGYLALAFSPHVFFAYLGFGVFGGGAAGFVYATCVNMVGKWYPERKGGKTGFVNGGFAYGSVPFIFLFTSYLDVENYEGLLLAVGVFLAGFGGGQRLLLQGPAEELVAPARRPAESQ